jgi:hypothetical protein
MNLLPGFVIQQFCAIANRGGTPFAKHHVAIAFGSVYGVPAVFAHPGLKLSVGVLYHRNSRCHETSSAHLAGRRNEAKGYRGPVTDGGWLSTSEY